jgi:phenylalanyl-tRNA synthetase beta chain
MRVPYSWLRELVADLPDVDVVAERLTMCGLEVESVRRADPTLVEGLVTARILECRKHPNADRLTLCTVDAGEGATPIVCGATNMKAGDAVVLARPGTVLPDGRKIQRSKIRGEESRGMLCAAGEIGLDETTPGILILDPRTAAGESAARLLGIAEAVIEIGVTPNRGDCLSMRGVAREVAAVCELRTKQSSPDVVRPGVPGRIPVSVDDAALCPLYTGIEVRGVTVAPSPAWLAARLQACGLRPINNIVDVTNLVLWEYGQPLHAFDSDRLAGPAIRVAPVTQSTTTRTLDGQDRNLVAGDLVIRDGKGIAAIAGVMGGEGSAVQAATRNIFLESAVFAPSRVRSTSRRLGLISDSSYRFERGVDPSAVETALLRAAGLIAEIAGGRIEGGVSRAGAETAARAPLVLRIDRIAKLLGVAISQKRAAELLTRLECDVSAADERSLTVKTPAHRHDLEREVDLIEEVARLHGYDAVPSVAPRFSRVDAAVDRRGTAAARVRDALRARGMSEAISLEFLSPATNRQFGGLHPDTVGSVIVENPLRSDAGELRRSLVPGLLAARGLNVRNGRQTTDLFALARTFAAGEPAVEIDAVAGLLAGPRRTRSPRDEGAPEFWDAKGVVEHVLAAADVRGVADWCACSARTDLHPRAAAGVRIGGREVGYVGELHPDALVEAEVDGPVFVFELDLGVLLELAETRAEFRPLPRYPASWRDVSFVVADALPAGVVIAAAQGLGEPLLVTTAVFDEYRGPGVPAGCRALAFRLTYRAEDRTLTEEEVVSAHERVVGHLLGALDLALRA